MELRFENITKRYGQKTALDGFDVTLGEGIHALLGPNGSGKSTLMNILAGLLAPTSGSVRLDGRDIIAMGGDYRAILGFMPQDCGFYPSFTAQQTLEYFAALREVKNAPQRIDELLELVNLADDRRRRVGGFSGGMKRRLGIALALLNDPKILILDEPTAGLDPKERMRLRAALSRLSRDRMILLATHIVPDIESISDSVLLLKKGRLIAHGTPEELCRSIDGQVWEIPVTPQQEKEMLLPDSCAGIVRRESGAFLHTLSEQRPAENALPVKPQLEDVYMHCFGELPEVAHDTDIHS
ncbi:MAG: ABC transporter ATP-binding protein [Ruminococcus sp.]|nr:ABC transporter ATP-binding protein [Ruminococcus sp.]